MNYRCQIIYFFGAILAIFPPGPSSEAQDGDHPIWVGGRPIPRAKMLILGEEPDSTDDELEQPAENATDDLLDSTPESNNLRQLKASGDVPPLRAPTLPLGAQLSPPILSEPPILAIADETVVGVGFAEVGDSSSRTIALASGHSPEGNAVADAAAAITTAGIMAAAVANQPAASAAAPTIPQPIVVNSEALMTQLGDAIHSRWTSGFWVGVFSVLVLVLLFVLLFAPYLGWEERRPATVEKSAASSSPAMPALEGPAFSSIGVEYQRCREAKAKKEGEQAAAIATAILHSNLELREQLANA